MASPTGLLSYFDEMMRVMSVLTTGYEHDEAEFIKFVENQELCRQAWNRCEIQFAGVERDKSRLHDACESLEIKLKHARSLADDEMKKRMRVETQMQHLERQVALIRELLCDKEGDGKSLARLQLEKHLSAIEESMSSTAFSDDSIQPNSEDIDVTKSRSRFSLSLDKQQQQRSREEVLASAPPESDDVIDDLPPRRIHFEDEHYGELEGGRGDQSVHVTTTTTVALAPLPEPARAPPLEKEFRRPPMAKERRKPSRHHVKTVVGTPGPSRVLIEETTSTDSVDGVMTPDVAKPVALLPPQSSSSVLLLQSRGHTFCSKTIIKPESCQPCGRKIHFGSSALRCKDCRAVCHPECKTNLPLPCIPHVSTPSKKNRSEMLLESYCPLRRPRIPAIVIHCIQEIERRGLNELGIYRVSGSDRDVKELKEKFLRGKGNRDLTQVADINVICCTLKEFFRNLKDSLLTSALFETFALAAEAEASEESLALMFEAITELPPANKDTLACLILHLQKVSSHSAHNQMTSSSLAKIFGPTIVGYSSLNPSPATMLQDTKKQPLIIEKLLSIPEGFWQQFLMSDNEANGGTPLRRNLRTPRKGPLSTESPEPRPILENMLGTLPKRVESRQKQQFTPLKRAGGTKTVPSAKKGRFFSSPSAARK
ncbi:rac GTPase-activating protein 1-like [Oscarella lobularis]|uniref:rac GTPase-activating protein 1-like n=1 Tax=Oscarella lobularis TaxID=121494 RepID=UPI0033141D71